MDQAKIGALLRTLRTDQGLTQEQLAERFGVSGRSVSRWETGRNLPELELLVELADFYKADLRALLEGEFRAAQADQALEDTLRSAADYSSQQRQRLTRRLHWLFWVGLAASLLYTILYFTGWADNFLGGLCMGITTGMMAVGVLMTSPQASRIAAAKARLLGWKS